MSEKRITPSELTLDVNGTTQISKGNVADARNFVNIPVKLKEYSNWVVWIYGDKTGKNGKYPKVLKNPKTGGYASVSNSSTWGTYTQAVDAFNTGKFAGIGFVLVQGYGLFCIDLDGSYIDGELSQLAQKYMRTYPSWTEISVSGLGVHIWGFTDKDFEPKSKNFSIDGNKVEVYTGNRFIAITGDVIGDENKLNFCDLSDFGSKVVGDAPLRSANSGTQLVHLNCPELAKTTREERRFADNLFRTDAGFKKLWQGDFSTCKNDRSQVDYIVAVKLNRSCAKIIKNYSDRYQMIRKLMVSNKHLLRDKWFADRSGKWIDYLHMTIDKAMTANAAFEGVK